MAKRMAGDRSVVPDYVEPMLATPDGGQLRDDPKYAYEFKWDGYRAIMRVAADGTTVLTSRNNNDFTGRYPELAGAMAEALGRRRAVLDGEIVALDDAGRPDFGLLQNHDTSARAVAYFVFDVLQMGDDVLLDHSYDQRRKVLEEIEPPDKNLVAITPSYSHADLSATDMTPQDLLDVAATSGLEGLVAKVRTSKYQPGRRSPEWLKHPLIQTLEVVIGGWRPGQGNRGGLIGGLLLGAHDRDTGDLLYIGDVGTGFTHQALLDAQENSRRSSARPARSPTRCRATAPARPLVEPSLVGEVVYRQFTPREHRLRHTAWRGWRPDRVPSEALVPQAGRGARVIPMAEQKVTVQVGQRRMALSNLDKPLYPNGFTKGEVVHFYTCIAQSCSRTCGARPVTLALARGHHWSGVLRRTSPAAPPTGSAPPRCPAPAPAAAKDPDDHLPADRGSAEPGVGGQPRRPRAARARNGPWAPDRTAVPRPPRIRPGSGTGRDRGGVRPRRRTAARSPHRGRAQPLPKTSGSKGMQVCCGVRTRSPERTSAYAKAIAEQLAREIPERVVAKMAKDLRMNKVFIDWSQNNPAKTTIAPYSLRARGTPTASTPLTWDEVRGCRTPAELTFTAGDLLQRVADHGDLLAALTTPGWHCPPGDPQSPLVAAAR